MKILSQKKTGRLPHIVRLLNDRDLGPPRAALGPSRSRRDPG